MLFYLRAHAFAQAHGPPARMGSRSALALAAMLAGAAVAQPSPSPSPSPLAAYQYALVDDAMRSVASSIKTAAMVNTTAWDRLAYMTDTFGPRFSGTVGLEQALDWIVATATAEDGLNVIQEPVQVQQWVRGREWASLISPRNKSLHFVGLGMSNGSNGQIITAPVVVVSSYDEFMALPASSITGNIILFDAPFVSYGQTVAYRVAAAGWVASRGGAAALIRSISPYGIQTPHTGGSGVAAVPAGALSIEDATQLHRMYNRGQAPVVSLYMEAQLMPNTVPSRNIIMELRGSERPYEYVVLGGHSDSWDIAEGAMDDGGGLLASWEALRLIKTLGLTPKRTLRIVGWVNEENGAAGGSAYASDYAATLPNTSLALETDEGAFSPYGLVVQAHGAAVNQLTLFGELFDGIGGGVITTTSGAPGTDIAATCATGVPCAGLLVLDPRQSNYSNNPCAGFVASGGTAPSDSISDGYFWFHHTAADTIDRMDPVCMCVFGLASRGSAASSDLCVVLPCRCNCRPWRPPSPSIS